MALRLSKELDAARKFGEQLDATVTSKNYPTADRNMLLLAYWELVPAFIEGFTV